jgi:cellobiose phosphorylase
MTALAGLLEAAASRARWRDVVVAQEILELVDQGQVGDYDNIAKKQKRVEWYFEDVAKGFSGRTMTVPVATLVRDLRRKAEWIVQHLNKKEWIQARGQSWFNGYYDNAGRRVEGVNGSHVRMTLAGQVYPVMTGVAPVDRVRQVVKAVNAHLWDKSLGGVRLNTNFGTIQPNLGRAFSFAFGEKENGAIFSHMAVMYSYALYKRGFVNEGHRVLNGLFQMATHSARSRIFPGLPEYFNNEGRGRYAYLTGSASWYVLTLLTQAYGVRGEWGDLLLAPKLTPSQFDAHGQASVQVTFAGRPVTVIYHNPKKLTYEKIRIKNIKTEKGPVAFARISDKEAVISRAWITRQKNIRLHVELGEAK